MATTVAELLATLGLDASQFHKSVDDVEGKGSSLGRTFSGLAAVGGGVLAAGFATATAGAVILGKELATDIQMAAEAEKIQAQLNAVLESTGGIAGVTADEANELASALASVTTFDDDAIVAGESLLLTFTGIGEEVFPRVTETMLDMSQAMGQDVKSSAIQLGKALNDPAAGLTALTRVGVVFTEEQEKMVKEMTAAGDIMGAQTIILDELQKEFGGSAEAAGSTAAGQFTIFKNTIDNIRESVGEKLLPILGDLAKMLLEGINRPEVKAFIDNLANSIANWAQIAVQQIPVIIGWFRQAFDWLRANQPIVVGVLAALGVAVLAFGVTVASAAITAMAPLLPVIAIMLAVGAIAYLVYRAWTENWGGIQDKVKAVWAQLQPVFNTIRTWLATNIPIALQALSNYWNNVLLPAIRAVWSFLQTYIIPLFKSVANLVGAVVKLAFTALIGYIQNVVLPRFREMYQYFEANILPVIQRVASWLGDKLSPAFHDIGDAISSVIGWVDRMAERLNSISLPSWLTPGSPTPFEIGLLGIADAMKDVNRIGLPSLAVSGVDALSAGTTSGVGGINIYVTSDGVTDERDIANKIRGAVGVILRDKGLS